MSRGSVTGVDWGARMAGGRALDPYLIWADFTRFAAAGPLDPDAPLPFIIESMPGVLSAKGLPRPLNGVTVPEVYRQAASARPHQKAFFTAFVPPADISALVDAEASINCFQLSLARWGAELPLGCGNPIRPALPLPPASPGRGAAVAAHTVVGIIDDGCPYAHRNLQDARGRTRVRHLWDQGAPAARSLRGPWSAAKGFIGGLETDGANLDSYLSAFPGARAYPALGIDRITGRPRTHGSAVCHLAAGSRMPIDLSGRRSAMQDAASELPIVFVQLPLQTVADTTGGSIGFHALDALHYILDRARELVRPSDAGARAVPQVVVNLSYGSIAGPHDGTSLVERALVDFLQANENVSLVVAAGNSNRDAVHLEFALAAGCNYTIDCMIAADNVLESYVEVWWPDGADLGGIEVRLRAPGDGSARVVARHGEMAFDDVGGARCGLIFCKRVCQGQSGTMTLIAIAATRGPRAAPPGRWQVEIANAGSQTITGINAWVERNDHVLGPRRRQQAFVMTNAAEMPKRNNMVLASMSNVDSHAAFGEAYTVRYLVAGASRLFDGQRSDYSSTGPARGLKRKGPDGLAPGDLGCAQPGLLVDGPQDGLSSRASGSSAAAAIVARQLAADFERRARAASRQRNPPPADNVASMRVTFQPADEDGWFRIEPRASAAG